MQNYRKIKISNRFEKRKWDNKLVPALILKGEWLKEAGFEADSHCTIKVEKGRLILLSI
jgi:toxic protein SymE